jgi:hypothetical protein
VYDGSLEPRRARLVFAVLSFFFLGTLLVWLRLDRSPPGWDDGYYLTSSLVMYDALTTGGIPGYAKQFLTVMQIKPPLIAVLPTPVYLIAGRNARLAHAVNFAFLLILFAALYRMGRRYASRRAGLIAMYIAGTMPILYGLSRWYLVDCGLTAIVCVAIYLVSEWNDSNGIWKGLLLGVTCGLGLLMKFSFPLYVLVPLLYFAARARRVMLRPKTLWAFAASVAALALPWYLFNFRRAFETALDAGSGETARLYKTGAILSLPDIWRYFGNVFNVGPSLYFLALPVLCLAFAGAVRPAGKRGLLLCALWASPFLFLTFGHYRELRYAAPLYPALALALGILVDAALARRGAAASALACALLALPSVSMLQTSFGVFGDRPFELGGLLFVGPKLDYARMYNRTGWPHREILADIYRQTNFTGGEKKPLIIGADSVRFNANNFELYALERKLPFRVVTTAYETDLNSLFPLLESAAYFLYKEGGEPVAPFNPLGNAAIKEVRGGGKFVELPMARTLPDGGVAHVFANLSPNRFTRTGAFLSAGADNIQDCNVLFDGKLQLAGLSCQRIPEGLEVKYRWRCIRPAGRDYWCFTHILNKQGAIIGYLDHPILNGEPATSLWKPGDTAIERLIFRMPQVPAEEAYHLRLGLFHRESGDRLPITASEFPLADQGTAIIASETPPSR